MNAMSRIIRILAGALALAFSTTVQTAVLQA
jgi:hypothetical protein